MSAYSQQQYQDRLAIDPFAMSPEQEASWKASVEKREAERKAKQDAVAADNRWWDRSWKIMICLMILQIFFTAVHLLAVIIKVGAA